MQDVDVLVNTPSTCMYYYNKTKMLNKKLCYNYEIKMYNQVDDRKNVILLTESFSKLIKLKIFGKHRAAIFRAIVRGLTVTHHVIP